MYIMEKGVNYYRKLIEERVLDDSEVMEIINTKSYNVLTDLATKQNLSKRCISKLLDGDYYNYYSMYILISYQILDDELIEKVIRVSGDSRVSELILYQNLTNFIKSESDFLIKLILEGSDRYNSIGERAMLAIGILSNQNLPESILERIKSFIGLDRYGGLDNVKSPIDIPKFEKREDSGTIIGYILGSGSERDVIRIDRLNNLSGYTIHSVPNERFSDWLKIELPMTTKIDRLRPVDKFSKISYIKNGKTVFNY